MGMLKEKVIMVFLPPLSVGVNSYKEAFAPVMVKSKPISRTISYPEKQTVNRTFFMEKKLGVFIRAGLFISIKMVNLMVSS